MTLERTITIGVVADSHIPDRARRLHPLAVSSLQAAGVELILHAGDISGPDVLQELGRIAPVEAVRGNRDWLYHGSLPLVKRLEIGGVVVALTHGHGGFVNYLRDKAVYLREGYNLDRLIPKLMNLVADAGVVVFGHTHRAEKMRIADRLLFNPGSVNFGFRRSSYPSYGLIRILPGGQVEAEIVPLNGYRLVGGSWEKAEGGGAKP
jgi:hypothetical protein